MAAKPTINTILQLVQEIFGKNALSKTIGTRTNVIRLPDASVKRLIKGELDIARANDAQLETFRRQAEELIPEIPRMNDQELLTFKGNLQRYYDRMYPPKAEVFDFQTKTQVPKQGVEQLETNLGVPSDIDINSPLGRMFQKTQQMKTEMKSAMGETKPIGQFGPEADRMLKSKRESIFGKDYDRQMNESFIKTVYKNNDPDTAEGVLKYFNDVEDRRQFQKMLREGGGQEKTSYSLMTPITNEILNRFIRADKIKLSPGMRENLLKGDRSGLRGKPVETFMEYFGVDNMEVLDNFLASKGSDYFVKNNYKQVVDDFMKSYPDLITPEFTRRTGGQLKVMNQPERDLLTFEEKVNFLTGNLGEKGPLSKSLKEYYNKNIDPTDPDITSYIMQYAKEGPERVREVIKNLPDGYLDEAPEVVRRLLKIDAEPEMFATGGRVGFKDGTDPKVSFDASFSKGDQGQIFNSILNLEVPLSEKLKLLTQAGYFSGRFEDGFKISDLDRTIGLSYGNPDEEGLSGYAKYNLDTDEPNIGIQYTKKFKEGGVVPRLKAGKGIVEAMMKFILENKDRINELYSVTADQITMESLERLAKEAPERLKNMYEKLFSHINLKKGEAPKTDLKKVRTQKKKTDDIEKELAKSEQIPVKDITDPSTLTTEELIEFRKTNRAGKGQFTNAEAIIARLENTIKEVKPGDEDYEYVSQTFPNFIKELKAKPELANNENVWNNLMSDLPSDQRFVKYDDGTVDFQTKRPSHTFKLRKDLDTDRRGVGAELTSAEKLYDEYIYYRDELGNFEGSFDDFIVARRKAGSLYAEETPLSTEAVKRKQHASGGLAYLMGL
jgi:hypothetical protein